jgi:hypothetical protein
MPWSLVKLRPHNTCVIRR